MSKELLDIEPEDLVIDEGQEPESEAATADSADVSRETTDETQETAQAKTNEELEAAQKAAAENSYKRREAERKLKEYETRIAQLEQASQGARPDVPEVPNKYDFDSDEKYYAALRERDEKLKAQVEFDAQQRIAIQQKEQQQREAQQSKQKELEEKAQAYSLNAAKLGVDQNQLRQAGEVVQQYGLHPGVVEVILDDPQGPLITQYLGANLHELDRIASMNPYSAASIIGSEIKAKASELQPRTTAAPDPAPVLDGAGSPSKERGPKGATYE